MNNTATAFEPTAPLESVVCTEELNRRPRRPPDHERENNALVSLVQALADSPGTILQTMAEKMLGVFECGSAGFSLLSKDETRFHWAAIAGAWQSHLGGGTPRQFGPCGDVLDCNAPILFRHWERRYPHLLAATPAAEEGLLVPFYLEGKAVGTIWAIAHDENRKFDNEDLRTLVSLGMFASIACRAVEQLHALGEAQARLQSEKDLRAINEALVVSSRKQHELVDQAEKATSLLRASEAHFRGVIDALPAAVYTTDAEGRLTHFNAAAAECCGRTPELGIDRWCVAWKMYRSDGTLLPHDECPMAVSLKEGRAIRGEEVIVERPDGTRRWVEPYPTPLRDADGRIFAGINMVIDITDRKNAEVALRESEERYRTLFDSIDEGFCVIELIFDALDQPVDYRFLEVNPAFEAQSGIRGAKGKRVLELVPDLGEHWFETYGKVHQTGEPIRLEVEVKALDRWLDLYACRIGGPGTRKVAVVFSDITDRRKDEEALRQSSVRFEALFNASPIGMYLVDQDLRLRLVNQTALPILGDSGDLIGRDFGEVVHLLWTPEIADDILARFRHTLATGEFYSAPEFCEERYDRKVREYYDWQIHRIALPNGQYGVVCYFVDISERMRLANELRQYAMNLADSDRRKDVFLATLAHELRNPLAPIRNGLQVIRLAGVSGVVERARAMMDRQLTQLVRLVDDLLDVSRVTEGKFELRRERIDLRAVIGAAVETSRPTIEQAGHEFVVYLPDDPVFVDGDITRLAQVVSNLLNNSAKYTHPGGHVRLRAGIEDGMAVVSVKDDGVGIPSAMLRKVFEMFTQVDRALEKTTGGLGIGLSLVKGLVEMHGGTTEVHSDGEGLGSEFILRLPVLVSEGVVLDSKHGVANEAQPSGCRILVVDDNQDSADWLGQFLELLGNEVRTANDGEAGIKVAASFRPNVVLMDIGMPKLNGYEAARRIREESWGRDMTLVALTGWGQEDDRNKSSDAGFDHHLVKPVDGAVLTKLLAELQLTALPLESLVEGSPPSAPFVNERLYLNK